MWFFLPSREKSVFLIIFLTVFLAFFSAEAVLAATGTISSSYKYAWGNSSGWINFKPTNGNVSITDNVLTVQGKTERKSEVDEKDFYRKEMRYGSFYRTIPLPVAVLGDKAEAKSENGVLKITVPKASEEKNKAIKVKVVKGKK